MSEFRSKEDDGTFTAIFMLLSCGTVVSVLVCAGMGYGAYGLGGLMAGAGLGIPLPWIGAFLYSLRLGAKGPL